MRQVIVASVLAAAFAAPVAAAEPAPAAGDATAQRCMFARSVHGFEVKDRQTIVLVAGARQRLVATLGAGCLSADDPIELAVIAKGACVSVGDTIAYRHPGLGPQRCMIVKLEPEPQKSPAAPEGG